MQLEVLDRKIVKIEEQLKKLLDDYEEFKEIISSRMLQQDVVVDEIADSLKELKRKLR